ncbi:MAG: hypothetical protein WC900_02690, partial [Oscillospiraceae bacterium]
EIKTEVTAVEAAVLSPLFGLEEIKTEVTAIEAAVLSDTFGLEEIKTEVTAIETAVLSDTFGLEEIKTEVTAIETAVLSDTFGLEEIKTEVTAIETAVLSDTFGLEEIKTEVTAIETAVLSDTFGLEEIKTEVAAIEGTLEVFSSVNKTTGIAVLDPNAVSFELRIFNSTGVAVTSTASIFSIAVGTTQVYTSGAQLIAAGAVFDVEVTIAGLSETPANFEVTFTNLPDGVYGSVTVRATDVTTGDLIAANTYRSIELIGF